VLGVFTVHTILRIHGVPGLNAAAGSAAYSFKPGFHRMPQRGLLTHHARSRKVQAGATSGLAALPMSAAQGHALQAIAHQLLAALDPYQDSLGELVAGWPDLAFYRGVSARIDQIRNYTLALPEIRVQWAALLVAHTTLVQALCKLAPGSEAEAAPQLRDLRDEHAACVAALRARLRWAIERRALGLAR
jgi:hypothetical protein